MLLFAKVRLFDLIEPRDIRNKAYQYKIQAKHVDFVICNKNLIAKIIIELDDSSHNSKERKERDKFVDMVLKDCGYKVLRYRYINSEELKKVLLSITENPTSV